MVVPLTNVRRLPWHEVAAVAQQERADVVAEHGSSHAIEGRVDDVVAGSEQHQRAGVIVLREQSRLRSCRRA